MAEKRSKRDAEELVMVPLGGIGEIGMNVYLYGLGTSEQRQWIMVDLGITFPHDMEPGVDVVLPDLRFIEEEKKNLLAIVLTHAHEDHFGAVADLWPKLKVPVYATPFTAALLKTKLAEFGSRGEIPIHEIPLGGRFKLGAFDLEYITMAHSIPEPNGLAIRTPVGNVFHTGDWKIDPDPITGKPTDMERIAAFGAEGIDVLIGDSTNALREGISPSETDVAKSLAKLVKGAKQRVAITTFASNVGRIRSVAEAARAADRELVVVGRAMHRMIRVAQDTGYLSANLKIRDQNDYGYLPPDKVVALLTGSQGEPRAAMARMAFDQHPDVSLSKGDMIIFSSRTIPGNEKSIGRIQNALADKGIDIITDAEALVHVTGHPRREELKQLYQLAKPRALIPMHGEARHLEAHAQFARDIGIKDVLSIRDGKMVRLAPGPLKVIDDVPIGRVYRDGHLFLADAEGSVRDRRRLAIAGIVVVSVVMSGKGELLADPDVVLDGVPREDAEGQAMEDVVLDAVEGAFVSIPRPRRKDAGLVSEALRRAARSAVYRAWGKKPICKVMLTVV